MKKTTYRLRNWSQYTNALKQRGSITFHFAPDVAQGWMSQHKTGRKGASPTYADQAIAACLSVKIVFGLPLRQTQGFVQSVLRLLDLSHLPTPDYSTLCRRQKDLSVPLSHSRSPREPIHVVVDSTGLKVFGEGEWQVKKHGASKRRTWRKLHLGVDEATGEIVAVVTTEADVADGTAFPRVLAQVEPPLRQCSCDGAYDWWQIWEAIEARGAKATIPPRSGAVIRQHGNCAASPLPRDEVLRAIRRSGLRRWKQESGYSRRSLAETAMMRQKVLFGSGLWSRSLARQSFARAPIGGMLSALRGVEPLYHIGNARQLPCGGGDVRDRPSKPGEDHLPQSFMQQSPF
jgi:hypothetical protein